MKVSVYNPANIAPDISIDEALVKGSKPESISATLLPETEESLDVAEIDMDR